MRAVPLPRAVTVPSESTVKTPSSPLDHVTAPEYGSPFWSSISAEKDAVVPSAVRVALPGVTLSEVAAGLSHPVAARTSASSTPIRGAGGRRCDR